MTLAWVIRGVQGLLGGWHLKGLMSQALAFLVYRRMSEINAKMGRLAARFAAGGLFCRVPRRVMAPRPVVEREDGPRVRVARIWPGRFGWMVRIGAWQAAGVGAQLRGWLEQPETVELLVAAPQAARILRPLCRMLMIETALLRPRLAGDAIDIVEAAPVVREVRKRVRTKRPPIDWGRIPLPRGVISWARREGFGKLPRG